MARTLLLFSFLAIGCAGTVAAGGQSTQTSTSETVTPRPTVQATAIAENGLAVTIETYCSETRLRTAIARLRWSMPAALFDAKRSGAAAMEAQSIETTVFKNGFEKGLFVSLPLSERATAERPIMPRADARLKRPTLRAFQIRVVEVEAPVREQTAPADAESARTGVMSAVVENLEPGVNYTWRVAIDIAGGKAVSAAVRTRAPICPADIVGSPAVPRRKP